MFSQQDIAQIQHRGSNLDTVTEQINHFKNGFPFLNIIKAATVGDGLLRLSDAEVQKYVELFENKANSLDLLKFVPASGAASRMFKTLFEYMELGKSADLNNANKAIKQFFGEIEKFAFYQDLPKNTDEYSILEYLLTAKGLDYGNLPKGLLAFHQYKNTPRTPAEEHLVEGANYANSKGIAKLHFTVSPEHRPKFNELIERVLRNYESVFGVKYELSFSEQKPSTDTIAVDENDNPFRNSEGKLLFRPAGHGALLENLNDQNSDIIFIKNVDNVVPDYLKSETIAYKKALAGVLLVYQDMIFDYLDSLKNADEVLVAEIDNFLINDLCIAPPVNYPQFSIAEKITYQEQKLNRPLRVCGMVKNVGEPGGGPFWAKNADGSVSLQVVESAQVDFKNDEQKTIFDTATHFNPVDLICSTKNASGEKYDLLQFRDMQTGFITAKSQNGKTLKAQELPGLWNGSMANWNTIFVEVPLITFNPVKTVNDLLRKEHQPV
jgi:Domain of unknown function (DUF4301)